MLNRIHAFGVFQLRVNGGPLHSTNLGASPSIWRILHQPKGHLSGVTAKVHSMDAVLDTFSMGVPRPDGLWICAHRVRKVWERYAESVGSAAVYVERILNSIRLQLLQKLSHRRFDHRRLSEHGSLQFLLDGGGAISGYYILVLVVNHFYIVRLERQN